MENQAHTIITNVPTRYNVPMPSAAGGAQAVIAPVTDPARLKRLLLVKLSSLGDVVHALPLVEALRTGLGTSVEIGWAVRSKFADLLRGNPHLTRVSELAGSGAGDLWAFGKTLRADGYDAALDAQGLFVSGLVMRLSGAPLRVGLDRNREGNALFLTHPVVPAKTRSHMVTHLLGFCDALGVPRLAPRPQMYLADGEKSAAEDLLSAAGNGPRVGFIIGASVAFKAWPTERWVELARLLAKDGLRVVLLGGPGETETAARIETEAGGAVAANLTGKTPPRVLASVLARCAVVVGGDSGPTHLAVGVGTPVVGLYGVTDPVRTGPNWGPAPAITLDYAEKDAPPETRRPRHPTLPDAIARIPANAAADAVRTLLEAPKSPRP
jgi:heptosyltransferase I